MEKPVEPGRAPGARRRMTPALAEILTLDPVRDHQRIAYLIYAYEFPFDLTRSLEFALFRTYAVPSISGLLDRTGEFRDRPQRRYDDTDLLVSALYQHGYDSVQGRVALRSMNRQHGRFRIPNEDFLYVLSTFVYEPIRWIDRFGRRPMVEQERLAQFHFWRAIGRRMGIREIPEDFEAFERFSRDFERANFRFAESNRRIGLATRDLFLGWVLPRPLFPLGAPAIHALLDDPLREAFGFPPAPAPVRRAVESALRLRSRAAALLPQSARPRSRLEIRRRSYPDGYRLEELGPPAREA